MSLPGFGMAAWRKFEDYASLKKHINANFIKQWDPDYTYEIIKHGSTLSTGATALEMLSLENGAVSFIGKTELEIFGALSDNAGSYDGAVCTLVYKDQDGAQHTATSTVAADNTTEVAFTDTTSGIAVTDYYCAVSATITPVIPAGDTYGIGATGALTVAAGGVVFDAAETSATEANMSGVGNLYGFAATDHADSDGSVLHLDYMTPWGEVKKGALCTYAAASDTHVLFYESDATTTVKDFYRVISLVTTKTTTALGHEGLIGDQDAADNGGGGDVYGCINELTDAAVIMRMTAPHANANCDLYFGKFVASTTISGVQADQYQMWVKFTPYGDSIEKTWRYDFSGEFEIEPSVLLEPDTSVTFYVSDSNDAAVIGLTVWYILAKDM